MAIYRCLLRISNNLAWKSRSEMLSRQGFQLPESLRLLYQRFISNLTRAYTDFWQAYKTVIPHKRHRAVGKETGLTNHIERLNNTFRQRVSRLVRSSLSFSKKLNNHIGAIWYFIHGYNAELDRI